MKKLCKSSKDKMFTGVCGGIAEYFGIDSTLVRIIAAILALGGGSGILIYVICMILMPEYPC